MPTSRSIKWGGNGSRFRFLSKKERGRERPQAHTPPRLTALGSVGQTILPEGDSLKSACLLLPNKEFCHFPLVIQSESLPPQPPVFIFIEVSPGKLAFWSIPDLSLFPFLLPSTPRFSGRAAVSPACLCPRHACPISRHLVLGFPVFEPGSQRVQCAPPADSDDLSPGSSQRRAGRNT